MTAAVTRAAAGRPARGEAPVLELASVSAAYGPFRALFDVSLTLARGEALALVGSNGAGKTTVARVVSGLVTPSAGRVLVDGADLTAARAKPYHFARAGIAHATEGRSVFATLSVEENLTLSFRRARGRGGVRGGLELAYEAFPVLGRRRKQLAGTMSGGEQRMLSMARVLVEKPKVLVADELSLGLAPKIVGELYASLARLRAEGVSLLIVEQHVGHALRLCDRVAVLGHGHVTWSGPAAEATGIVTRAFAPAG
ncbi:ABC transporter ATP-binding protein [Frankia sp. CNm7]|uniref:ABC transporter ATP-binding protein n=1 Tax=Frankia nepalensis TaxID=1836974 RepID=A0A937UUW6_9ACTN|nr:ABC transporter ATP-binding protein [Frankia nepalensis]MBL7500191.1 ABC transporter ATP-binding protein [Frankia nepalensis]MBL7509429.1 ABC transporter ATP-binding protein [Frankia nepalensis]MBL7522759.1 ABC transporter ATP-binding protein [Frankia nepalensis]MBL7631621.1 ABC transporter ATP-binding protein [Frankia nepalensis]